MVGLTGMGGGALMTPILVLIFKIEPLAAVSSDLVASFFMKPVGAFVHMRRGTVNLELVKWLCIGSVPSAFAGVFVLKALGGNELQDRVKLALGYALLVAALGLILKTYMTLRERARRRAAGLSVRDRRGDARDQRPTHPHPDHRCGRRSGRGHDQRGFGLADHHRAHRALPGAAGLEPGRHRPGPGGAAGGCRRRRATCSTATSSSG